MPQKGGVWWSINLPFFQDAILRVVIFIVTVVNCVPFQELSSLSCLLQGISTLRSRWRHLSYSFLFLDTPSTATVKAIFQASSKLVSFEKDYRNILREAGLLDMLVKLVQRGYEKLRLSSSAGTYCQNLEFASPTKR